MVVGVRRGKSLGLGLSGDEERAMKKLINNPREVVREMLEGLADLNPGLSLLADDNVVIRAGCALRTPPASRRSLGWRVGPRTCPCGLRR